MTRSHAKVYRFQLGKKHVLVVKIVQSATAHTTRGNALASNAAAVQIVKKRKGR